MTQVTDEMLVAYVDGELTPDEAADVERALRTDRQLGEAANMFRDTADWSRRAYDDILREPVPERLIRTATGDAGAGRPAPGLARHGRLAALAMAASIALAIGIGGGFGLSGLLEGGGDRQAGAMLVGAVNPAGDFHRALETTAGGTATAVAMSGGQGEIIVLTSFVDRNGRYCRDFQTSAAGLGAFGIACRGVGAWRVEAIVAPPARSDGGQFVTASGPGDDPLQALIDAMADGAPLSPEDEAALLHNRWSR